MLESSCDHIEVEYYTSIFILSIGGWLCHILLLVLSCAKASTTGISATIVVFGGNSSERVVGQCLLCSAAARDGLVAYEEYVQRNCVQKGETRELIRTVMSAINAESSTYCTRIGKFNLALHGS